VARLSADVDVTVDLGRRSSAELVGALAEAGFQLRVADIEGFVEATRVLPFVHRASRISVDVVLAGPGLDREAARWVKRRCRSGRIIPRAFHHPADGPPVRLYFRHEQASP
jgi:hypothetical protein